MNEKINHRAETDCNALEQDALAYIQQLEAAQPKWISVEDEPPEAGKTVQLLWKRASGKIQSVCGYMLPKNDVAKTFRFHILDYNIYAWEDITHWAPLLELPEEG